MYIIITSTSKSGDQSASTKPIRFGNGSEIVARQPTTTRLKDFFFASPVLMLTAAFMALDLLVCIAGLLFDHAVITGAPAWLKPIKFAISTGIYALSLVIIIRYTPIWKKTLRVVERLTGLALTVEIILIDLQAFRHTTSHFNVATPFDTYVYTIMGIAIAILWLSALVLTVATFRAHYASPSWAIAVRYGMLLAALGAGTGAFMVTPSHVQLQGAQNTHHITILGSHTVGGVDGGNGIPVLGWSAQHGDVRVPHFIGLHGLQMLALLALFLQRRRMPQSSAQRITFAAVVCYGSLFLITLTEALLKKPITDHGAIFITVWIVWLILSLISFVYATRTQTNSMQAAAASLRDVIA